LRWLIRPGAVALQAALGAPGAGLLAGWNEHLLGLQVVHAGVGRAEHERAVERHLAGRSPGRSISATLSGSSAFSPGLPGAVTAGRINPRAPRRVFSVTSASWVT
jgi:hypothetical protein